VNRLLKKGTKTTYNPLIIRIKKD